MRLLVIVKMAATKSPTSGLILFDVNGILCAKYDPLELNIDDGIKLNSHYAILPRPGIVEYVEELAKTYTLGIYSSTKRHNIDVILSAIFGKKIPFQFIADRSYTWLHPAYGNDPNIKPYDTIKKLETIWENPVFNPDRRWGPSNTLIIDDDLSKVECNSEDNYWIAEPCRL